MSRAVALLALAVPFAAVPAAAQVLTAPLCYTGSPGDEVILLGADLGGTTAVRFTANVGGFVGQMSIEVLAGVSTPSVIVCQVPQFGAFAPLGSSSPGSPSASVAAIVGGQASSPVDFYLLEGHQPLDTLWTIGTGSTVPLPSIGHAYTTFDIFSDAAPITDNANARVMIANAPPGSVAVLAAGVETASGLPFGNGQFVVDLATLLIVGTATVGAGGTAELPTPIPAGLTGTFAFQWGYVHLGDLTIRVADGLSTTL